MTHTVVIIIAAVAATTAGAVAFGVGTAGYLSSSWQKGWVFHAAAYRREQWRKEVLSAWRR
jgi:hypothetical protein